MLGLADDPPPPAPAVERSIAEIAEHPGRCAGRKMLALGRGQFGSQRSLQAGVARQAEHVTDAVRLAPRHQFLVGKARVGTQHDAHLAPLAANPRNDARHFLDRAGAAGNVGAPCDALNLLSGSNSGLLVGAPSLSCGLECSLDVRASSYAAVAAGTAPESAFSNRVASPSLSAMSVGARS
jgi:hypothetical protein